MAEKKSQSWIDMPKKNLIKRGQFDQVTLKQIMSTLWENGVHYYVNITWTETRNAKKQTKPCKPYNKTKIVSLDYLL